MLAQIDWYPEMLPGVDGLSFIVNNPTLLVNEEQVPVRTHLYWFPLYDVLTLVSVKVDEVVPV